jgi:hypothetical protein
MRDGSLFRGGTDAHFVVLFSALFLASSKLRIARKVMRRTDDIIHIIHSIAALSIHQIDVHQQAVGRITLAHVLI